MSFTIWYLIGVVSTIMLIREDMDVQIWHLPIIAFAGLFGVVMAVAYVCVHKIDFTKVVIEKKKPNAKTSSK